MRRAALLLAVASCGKQAPEMSASCELGPEGEDVPKLLAGKPWLLHDLDVADDLPRLWHCVVEGRRLARVWSDEPAMRAETDRFDGVARLAYRVDHLGPELTIRWEGGSTTLATPTSVPKVTASVHVDGSGVAHVTGSVDGADAVTLAGEPVPVSAGRFTVDVPLPKWVFEHVTVADLPIDPLPSKLTMLVAAGAAHAMVTMPTPRLALGQWLDGVLAEGSPVPFAPPADFAGMARPTVVVFWEETPRLRALTRATTLGTIEVVAHVRTTDDGRRLAVLYTAADGVERARQTFDGDDELAITAWVQEHVNPVPR